MGIRDSILGVASLIHGMVMLPIVEKASEEIMKNYPRWMRYGDYHKQVHIPEAVRNHKVWLLSPDGSQKVQMEYLQARKIRDRRGWYINLYEPELPPFRGFFAISDIMPTLTMMSLLASAFTVRKRVGESNASFVELTKQTPAGQSINSIILTPS